MSSIFLPSILGFSASILSATFTLFMSRNTLYRLAYFGIFVLEFCTLHAQAQKLPFTNYNTANGLTHNRTHVIRQDGKGYIWIGTDLGIDRYDGRTFRHFSSPGNVYHSSRYCTRYADSVIFGVDHLGIAICYGDSVRFMRLNTKNTGSISGVACLNDSTFYVVDQPHGFFKISAGKTQQIQLPEPIINEWNFVDVLKDRQANIWLLSSLGLLFFHATDTQNPVNIPFFDKIYINSVRQDKNGDIYVACHLGVFRYSEVDIKNILTTSPEVILPPIAEITSITFDATGNVWMGSVNKGIYKYNKKNRSLARYGLSNGLVNQYAWDVFCDKENNLWVGTENGISKLTTQYYYSFDFANSDYQNIKDACVWNDSTLFFTNLLDAYSYSNDSITKIKGYKNVPGYIEHMLLKLPGNKLLANINTPVDAGSFSVNTLLYDFTQNEITNKKALNSVSSSIGQIYMDHGAVYEGSSMIVNTSSGLSVYKNGFFHQCAVSTDDSVKPKTTYIAGDKNGDLWIVSDHKNLIRYSKHWSNSDDSTYIFRQEDYINSKRTGIQCCTKIYVDSRGSIWACERGGGMTLLRTDKSSRVTRIDKFSANLFSSGIVNDILDHNLWVGTASGLDKIVFLNDSFTIEKDIYGSNLCGKYFFFVKKLRNKLFVGTTGCLGVIDLNQSELKTVPDVYISGIRINEKNELNLLGTAPKLNPDKNFISFEFTGISFKDERRIKYSYMLDGINKSWSEPQTDYTVNYSRIPPGTYTFKVKALSAQGVWSKPATFTFTIGRPFYKQLWFLALSVALVAAAIYSMYRYRISQFIKIQNIHDDIGATVSSINILANMAKSDLVSEAKRNQFLETIQEESKHVSESLNDIVWSINPTNDSIEIIFARMQRYASELFEAGNIAYEFNLPSLPMSEMSINMKQRQHVYLIFKEGVNNLVKYAHATKAEVRLSVTKTGLSLIISDNGKGFDTTTEHTGNGIYNMKKRADDINAMLEISSAIGLGTTIRLVLPL
jgi:ligand-binding sensor domain-containing protein/two-component sensor histidine kinase